MKKKIMILSMLIVIIIISIIIYFITYKKKQTFSINGATVAVLIDGKNASNFPDKGFYDVNVNCNGANGRWDYENWKLIIGEITEKVYCNLSFTTSSKTYLNEKIQSLLGNDQVFSNKLEAPVLRLIPSYTLEKSNYMNIVNSSSTYPWVWNETDKSWTSTNKGDEAKNTNSSITFSPHEDNYYQICYKQYSEDYYDYGTIYVDNKIVKNLKEKEYLKYTCTYLGKLTTSSTIEVSYRKNGSRNYYDDEVSFYIQAGNTYMNDNAGYRYEGESVNNYVWFNNELWRIIGVFGQERHGLLGEKLVKIIRADSLGAMAFGTTQNYGYNDWDSSYINKLLNGAYLRQENGNETAADYCYQYVTFLKGDCDYTKSGISAEYQKLIKDVYWQVGGITTSYSVYSGTAERLYLAEMEKQTFTASKIGLINGSDYMYSFSENESWLEDQGIEWSITPDSEKWFQSFAINSMNGLVSIDAKGGFNYRPVLYLDSNVYTYAGDGSKNNPYIIGM